MVDENNAPEQGTVPAEGQTEPEGETGLPGGFTTAEDIYQELLKQKEQYQNLEKKIGEQGNELGKFRALANNYPAELIVKAIETVEAKKTQQEEEVTEEVMDDPKKLSELIERKSRRIAQELVKKELGKLDSMATIRNKPQFDKLEAHIKGLMAQYPDIVPETAYRYCLGQLHEEELTKTPQTKPPVAQPAPKSGSVPGAPTVQISNKPTHTETTAELKARLERETGVRFTGQ